MGRAQLSRVDYEDAFERPLRPGADPSIREILVAIVETMPRSIRAAMRARDAVVSRIGLKTSAPIGPLDPEALVPGAQLGIFRIHELGDDRAIVGEDDRHLDFRVIVERRGAPGARTVAMITQVQFHGALGRAYFVPVGIGHRRIVPAMLRALADAL